MINFNLFSLFRDCIRGGADATSTEQTSRVVSGKNDAQPLRSDDVLINSLDGTTRKAQSEEYSDDQSDSNTSIDSVIEGDQPHPYLDG